MSEFYEEWERSNWGSYPDWIESKLHDARAELSGNSGQLEELRAELAAMTARAEKAEAVCEVADTLSRQCWQADNDGDLSEYIDGNVMIDTLLKIEAWREASK
jgi:hypothetical protein